MDKIKIYDTLKELAISPVCVGYEHINVAMDLIEANVHIPVCELYRQVAKINHSTASRVERAIRHIVQRGIGLGNIDKWREIFGYNINVYKGTIINSEFLWGLYRYLEIQ